MLPEFSDSDSDFEPLPPKIQKSEMTTTDFGRMKPESCTDLTNDENSVIKELKDVTAGVEMIEESLSRSLDNYEEIEREGSLHVWKTRTDP